MGSSLVLELMGSGYDRAVCVEQGRETTRHGRAVTNPWLERGVLDELSVEWSGILHVRLDVACSASSPLRRTTSVTLAAP